MRRFPYARFERLAIHGLVLSLVNIASILVGFWIYTLTRPAGQVAVQAPVAAALSILGFVAWSWAASQRLPERGRIRGKAELAWTYVASLVAMPVIFIPLHYLTQGYLTSFANIAVTWAFQAPVNLLAVLAAGAVLPRRGR